MATVTNLPGTLNIQIYVGATFALTLTWLDGDGEPIDLTGYTAAMNVVNGQDIVISLSTANGRISLGGLAGTMQLTIPASATAPLQPATCDYDLLLTSQAGVVTPLVAGICTIRKGSTANG